MARRRFTADEKWRILEEGQRSGAPVAEVCRRNQIVASQYYRWLRQVEEAAKEALRNGSGPRRRGQDDETQRLRDKIVQQQAVIAEVVEENLELKKGFSA